jgi:hypothetical protein
VVQLEAVVRVVARIQERHAERAQACTASTAHRGRGARRTAVLRVALLEVAHARDELLNGDVLRVREQVLLRGRARVVDERVGVRGEARDAADDVPAAASAP